MRRARLLALLAVTFLAGPGCATKPLIDHPDPKGRSLVLLVDASASMKDNDPGRADVVGASLAAALVGKHDNTGVLSYNWLARVVVPLRPSGEAAPREELRQAIREIDREGSTDFELALDAAYTAFEAANAPPGSCAIFLTDGLPSRRVSRGREFSGVDAGPLRIPEAVAKMAARSWRIFAIVLGPEAPKARSYMTHVVAPTGGAVFEALGPNALVDAYEKVAVQALGYLAAEHLSTADSLSVPPDMRRIAFVGTGLVGEITRDKEAVDPGKTLRFPRSGPVAVALIEDPEPGTYRVDSGASGSVLALVDPSWFLEFEKDSPPPSVEGGSTVALAVSLKGDETNVFRVRDRLTLAVEVAKAGKILATSPLSRPDKASVRFEGSFVAPQEDDSLTVTAVATLVEGGKTFTSRRSISISVKKGSGPTAPLKLEVKPAALDLAGFLGDELSGEISLSCNEAASADLQAPEGIVVPAKVDLVPGTPAKLLARAGKEAKGGSIAISARSSGAPVRIEVPVRIERGTLGTTAVDLGSVEAGESAGAEVEASHVTFVASPLKGEQGEVALSVSGNKLTARTDAKTSPGKYAGEVEARCGASVKKVSVVLLVRERASMPETLTLKGSWGWTSVAFDLPAKTPVFEPGPLVRDEKDATIAPDLDIRVSEVRPGRYELRVFAPTTLPPGRYSGTLKVTVGGDARTIAVVLEVKR